MDRFDATKEVIKAIDKIIVPMVWFSIIMLILEIELGTVNSHESHRVFLWSERWLAGIFTLEYAFRCWRNSGRNFYPVTPFGIIDLLAIAPFWCGFFVPVSWLHSIRTLRVLRLLKFFRYNRSLQLVALGFYKSWFMVRSLLFMAFLICMFTMIALYEIEGQVQPAFKNLFDCMWFTIVTGTTVGYGDVSPQTVAGKVVVMVFMLGGLSIFAAVFGAVASAFESVFRDEADPNVDPLVEFGKIVEQRRQMQNLDKSTGTTDAEDEAAAKQVEEKESEEE